MYPKFQTMRLMGIRRKGSRWSGEVLIEHAMVVDPKGAEPEVAR